MIAGLLKKHPFFLAGGIILLVCLLAYGQIVGMYFFLEDYLILYSVQHPDSPEAGYGSGVFGRPYGYAVTPFIPFYHLFGLNPQGYYIVEIILYFLASITVYFFAKTLTNNKKVALGSALIFASGYVGSESLYRLAVGWQNILAVIFISLSAALYYKYVKTPSIKYYLLALAVYLFTSEFSFYRAHGIILLILGIEILFNFRLIKSLFRMLPFILSYWYFYFYSLQDTINQGSKLSSFTRIVFNERNYNYLLVPFKTLENLFIPDRFHFPLLVFIVILVGILLWKRSKLLVYCLVFAIANYLVYFYNTPAASQETTHRYLIVSYVGIAVFWGIILSKIFKNKYKYLFFCLLIVILNIGLAWQDQRNIIQNRSQPSREFWQSFRSQVQNIPKQSAIYIDSKQDGISKPARDASIGAGSMSATTSFAVYYGLKWEEIYLAENFSELLNFIKVGKVGPQNIYTFFYSRNDGLVNTTNEIRSALFETGANSNIEALDNVNIPFYSPVLLKFSSETNIDLTGASYSDEKGGDVFKYLSFLASRERFYGRIKASASTESKYAEVGKIADRDSATSWKGDNLTWAAKQKEEVILNLGEVRQVGAVRVIPATLGRVPTKYLYECSLNGATWQELASFEKKIDKTEVFVDAFNPSSCAFIKLTILDTKSDTAPQISEIEIIESKFADLDINLAEEVEKNPFKFASSTADYQIISEYFAKNGVSGVICIFTDKSRQPVCKRHKFKIGGDSKGLFFIEQGGTTLQKIEFRVPERVKLSIENPEVEHLTYNELAKKGYIFDDRD